MGLHFILQHLDKSGTYVWILFVDFSSAFNTIIPTLLQTKLTQLSVPSSICQWITSFLRDRQQLVRLGRFLSKSHSANTGAPQGCVLSPLLFSLYTNDCISKDPSIKEKPPCTLPTYHHRQHCDCSGLIQVPGIHQLSGPEVGHSHRLVDIVKKVQQRLYFLRQLRKLNLPQELLKQFFSAVIESVLCTSITVWFGSATNPDIRRQQRTVRSAERIIGAPLTTLQELYTSRVRKRAQKITLDPSHPSHSFFELLPSGRRYRAPNTRTARHKNSFFPQAIHIMNS